MGAKPSLKSAGARDAYRRIVNVEFGSPDMKRMLATATAALLLAAAPALAALPVGAHAPQFVASALLGAALHILSRTVPEDAIIRILTNAIAGVKAGHLRQPQG